MSVTKIILFASCAISVVTCSKIVSLDENWVCFVKNSCQECLKISACSWCNSTNKCFSESVSTFRESCSNGTIRAKDYGFSLGLNAECACSEGQLENHCQHPEDPETVQCSGRGACVCGRCVCDAPDKDHPTKMVMGEYCEFDNFSCQGSRCNEGPYSLKQPQSPDDDDDDDKSLETLPKFLEEEQPLDT